MKLYHYIVGDESVEYETIFKLDANDRYFSKIKVITEYIDGNVRAKTDDVFVRFNTKEKKMMLGRYTGLHYAYFDKMNSSYGVIESDVLLCRDLKKELTKIKNDDLRIYKIISALYKKFLIT